MKFLLLASVVSVVIGLENVQAAKGTYHGEQFGNCSVSCKDGTSGTYNVDSKAGCDTKATSVCGAGNLAAGFPKYSNSKQVVEKKR